MTRRTQVFLVIFFIVLGIAMLVSQGSLPGSESTNVERLQQQIEKLEQRVAQLEQSQGLKVVPQPQRLLYSDNSRFRNIPEGWQQREFNGTPFYVVPLDTPKPAASTDSRASSR